MIPRFLLALGLAALMVVSGIGTYIYVGGRQSHVAAAPQKPTAAPRPHPFVLPGTLYVAQAGALYSLNSGRFHVLTAEEGWTQPSLTPDGKYLIVVKRGGYYSDVFMLNDFGQPIRQLTNNNSRNGYFDTGNFHWSFYPRLTPDASTLFMSYDEPKFGYEVDMSIWSMPFNGGRLRLWTSSNNYTGGDVQPIPLSNGAVLYSKFDRGPDQKLISQIWITSGPAAEGRALTSPGDDCSEPAVSADGRSLAMICTYEKQVSHLVIASFDGSNIGPLQEVITDQLVAQPTWAPDGSGIAYFAPGAPAAPFQLWWLPKNAYAPPPPSPVPSITPTPGGPHGGEVPSPTPTPAPIPIVVKPIQVTTNLDFDASSPMAWGS